MPARKDFYLVIQPSGAKSWAMRFRRPNGDRAKLVLGPLNTGKEIAGDPQIGQPLTPTAARALAGQINRQRAMGVDVIAARQTEQRKAKITSAGTATYQAAAKIFIASRTVRESGQKPRRWREDARMLGLDHPLDGGDGIVIKGGLCDRWRNRLISEITNDDIFLTIEEARSSGIPGFSGATMARRMRAAGKWPTPLPHFSGGCVDQGKLRSIHAPISTSRRGQEATACS